jgi:hypothetical protein
MRADEIAVLKAAINGPAVTAKRLWMLVSSHEFEDHSDRVLWQHIGELALTGEMNLESLLERVRREPTIGRWRFTKGEDYVWSFTKGRAPAAWVPAQRIASARLDRVDSNPHLQDGAAEADAAEADRKTTAAIARRLMRGE